MHSILSTFALAALLTTMQVTAMPQAVPRDFLSSEDVPGRNLTSRQDVLTNCEVGDKNIVAQDLNAQPGQSPAAFGQLWDAVDNMLCTELGCDSSKNFCVTASEGQDVCIRAEGQWGSPDMRGQFINGARGAFNRSVRRQDQPSGVIETGTDLIQLVSQSGPNSGWSLRVQLENQASEGGGQCPAIVNFIAQGGANIPEIGSIFGTVAFLCNGQEIFRGDATG